MTLKDLHEAMQDNVRAEEGPDFDLFVDFVESVGRLVAVFEKFAEEPAIDDSDAAAKRDLEFLDELVEAYRLR